MYIRSVIRTLVLNLCIDDLKYISVPFVYMEMYGTVIIKKHDTLSEIV